MYLSRIELDTRKRETLKALAYPGVMHGAVERCFEARSDRRLWRIDRCNNRTWLLILSAQKPDFTQLAQQLCAPGTEGLSKSYDALLAGIQNGQSYKFRLCANPIHRTKRDVKLPNNDTQARGQVRAHVTQDQQCQWLIDRAENCGFALELGEKITKTSKKRGETGQPFIDSHEVWSHPSFDVVHTEWKEFGKGNQNRPVTMRIAIFEGTLTVTDAERFKDKLIHGIGREKAYGCGLLTIMRIS